ATRLNRAAALLGLHRYSEAHDAAQSVLDDPHATSPHREKAIHRMSRAAYGMRDWERAKTHYQQLLADYPDNELAKEELQRVIARIEEARTGSYEPSIERKSRDQNTRHDVADYTGPVKVGPSR